MTGMTGIVPGLNYSVLFSSNSSSTDNIAADLISTLYGTTTAVPSNFASTGNPLTDLKLAQRNQTADVALEAKQPQVMQAIDAFKTAVANAPNIQSALQNPNVQKVLLTANGLSSYIGDTALVQKVFLSDPSDPKSLVYKLRDYNFVSAVQTFNFAKNGLAELQNPKVIASLSNGYAEVMWRQSLDQATPGLSNALVFLNQASSIKSVNDILDNVVNFYVVTTALGIPQDIVFQDQSAQQQAIKSRLDIAKLQDHSFVTSLTDQYLLTMQENKQSASSSGTDLTALAVKAGGLVV